MSHRDGRIRKHHTLLILTGFLACQLGMMAYVVSLDRQKERLVTAILHHNPTSVQRLLQAGVDPDCPIFPDRSDPITTILSLRFLYGSSTMQSRPLVLAAREGDARSMRLLLDRGADIDAKECATEETALIAAIRKRHKEATELLLQRHANPARVDQKRQNATIAAVQSGDPEMLSLVYRYRAFQLTKDLNGFNAIDWAKHLQDRPMVTLAENYALHPDGALLPGGPERGR